MARNRDVLPLSLAPRGLSRAEAAAYIGVSVGTFDVLVGDGRMPKPKLIGARRVWDRLRVDEAFSDLPGDEDALVEGGWNRDQRNSFTRHKPRVPTERPDKDADLSEIDFSTATPEQFQQFIANREDRYRAVVLGSEMNKRERSSLAQLYCARGTKLGYGKVKGGGYETQQRLSIRGFVAIEWDGQRFVSWQITPEGEAACIKLGLADRS